MNKDKREIKFRAWDNEINKIITPENWLALTFAGSVIKTDFNFNYKNAPQNKYEIMQYTGLKDKNGKEIYEGDIVAYPDTESEFVDVGLGGQGVKVAEYNINSFGVIEFYNGSFVLNITEQGEKLYKGYYTFNDLDSEFDCQRQLGEKVTYIEIIGNIYENPDLIKLT